MSPCSVQHRFLELSSRRRKTAIRIRIRSGGRRKRRMTKKGISSSRRSKRRRGGQGGQEVIRENEKDNEKKC